MLEATLRHAAWQRSPFTAPRSGHRRSIAPLTRCSSTSDHPGVTRRQGLAAAAASTVLLATMPSMAKSGQAEPQTGAPFQLPPLPYEKDALEPHMSQKTLYYHYEKHHASYLANLNKQLEGDGELSKLSLQEVMLRAWNGGKPTQAFNNAAQVVNHTFFWESMRPGGGGAPEGQLLTAIERDLGSFDKFKEQFTAAGATQFGSGWAWLVVGKDGKLKVAKTPNAENPWVQGEVPILTMDVWEHAYYLDRANRRPEYIATFMDSLINWEEVARRYERVA